MTRSLTLNAITRYMVMLCPKLAVSHRSDNFNLIPMTGIEPALRKEIGFESTAYTCSATSARYNTISGSFPLDHGFPRFTTFDPSASQPKYLMRLSGVEPEAHP